MNIQREKKCVPLGVSVYKACTKTITFSARLIERICTSIVLHRSFRKRSSARGGRLSSEFHSVSGAKSFSGPCC